ncbi:hypothetical protein [Paracoccus sp. MKU1]|uniref:hypothetical protein n=1 Tax=Paracoccus sp. MKU1 TaxID=1745182 RepID=UPI0007191144|nr:hypothetical protein [Paracoccus sp. MKU1]KRW94257.1 hypothetical protein AQY21_20215 [Paracoccus sp. MKU1]
MARLISPIWAIVAVLGIILGTVVYVGVMRAEEVKQAVRRATMETLGLVETEALKAENQLLRDQLTKIDNAGRQWRKAAAEAEAEAREAQARIDRYERENRIPDTCAVGDSLLGRLLAP